MRGDAQEASNSLNPPAWISPPKRHFLLNRDLQPSRQPVFHNPDVVFTPEVPTTRSSGDGPVEQHQAHNTYPHVRLIPRQLHTHLNPQVGGQDQSSHTCTPGNRTHHLLQASDIKAHLKRVRLQTFHQLLTATWKGKKRCHSSVAPYHLYLLISSIFCFFSSEFKVAHMAFLPLTHFTHITICDVDWSGGGAVTGPGPPSDLHVSMRTRNWM